MFSRGEVSLGGEEKKKTFGNVCYVLYPSVKLQHVFLFIDH